MYGCNKDCLILISFILIPFSIPFHSHFHSRSGVSLSSLKCFSSDADSCPEAGIGPLLQFPLPPRAGPVLLTLLFFPPAPFSYRVLRGSINSFHWSGTPVCSQRCCACTSVSEGVFLMYQWSDVLHVHLLLHHLVLSSLFFFFFNVHVCSPKN